MLDTSSGQELSSEIRDGISLITPSAAMRIVVPNGPKLDPFRQRYVLSELAEILPEVSEPSENANAGECLDAIPYSKYVDRLLSPGTTPFEKAAHAARILHAHDPGLFFATLKSLCSEREEGIHDRLCRALEVLEKLEYYDALLPWLRVLSQQPNERVRSKAVKLLCKAVPQKLLVEQQLKSHDSRVRANAIEALWFHQSPEATSIFRSALSDGSHRVVVNALVGLCHQNDETAMQKLIVLSQHPSEMFRAAVIWAFAHLYDERAIEPLRLLANDSSEIIRKKAAYVLAKLLYVREWMPFQALS
jgi:hypothetical protein